MEGKKHIGFSINSKFKCIKVYLKLNKKGKKIRVLYNGRKLRKGKRVYKTKKDCEKKIIKLKNKKQTKPKRKKEVKKTNKFGKPTCYFQTPYFGGLVPTVAQGVSGTPATGYSNASWMWPTPPGAKAYDTQQGVYRKY